MVALVLMVEMEDEETWSEYPRGIPSKNLQPLIREIHALYHYNFWQNVVNVHIVVRVDV